MQEFIIRIVFSAAAMYGVASMQQHSEPHATPVTTATQTISPPAMPVLRIYTGR